MEKSLKKGVDFLGSKMSLLGYHGVVDQDKAIKSLQYRAGIETVDIDRINKSSRESTLLYNHKGIPLETVCKQGEKDATYKIVPLGYNDKKTGNPLYGSFVKTGFSWDGIYMSTIDKLETRMVKNHTERNKGTISNDEKKLTRTFKATDHLVGHGLKEIRENIGPCGGNDIADQLDSDTKEKLRDIWSNGECTDGTEKTIFEDIYNILLFKEEWGCTKRNRLGFYLKTITTKIRGDYKEYKENKGNGYVISEDGGMCLFNTGLLDNYSNDILLLDLTFNRKNFYDKDFIIVKSKIHLLQYGFNRDDIAELPKPIKFYEKKGDMIFDGEIGDFDLEDSSKLHHIIKERIKRFPRNYRNKSPRELTERVKNAIDRAIKMSERNYKYVVPMYNLRARRIQYLIPLHLDNPLDGPPELVIVAGEEQGFYCIYTILKTEVAYYNARVVSMLDSTWLKLDE